MPNCQRCGSFVSTDFIRVFGGNDGELFGCIECAAVIELYEGNAAEVNP